MAAAWFTDSAPGGLQPRVSRPPVSLHPIKHLLKARAAVLALQGLGSSAELALGLPSKLPAAANMQRLLHLAAAPSPAAALGGRQRRRRQRPLPARRVYANEGMSVPSESFGGVSPERKASQPLQTFFTFCAAKARGSGDGALPRTHARTRILARASPPFLPPLPDPLCCCRSCWTSCEASGGQTWVHTTPREPQPSSNSWSRRACGTARCVQGRGRGNVPYEQPTGGLQEPAALPERRCTPPSPPPPHHLPRPGCPS